MQIRVNCCVQTNIARKDETEGCDSQQGITRQRNALADCTGAGAVDSTSAALDLPALLLAADAGLLPPVAGRLGPAAGFVPAALRWPALDAATSGRLVC